MDTLTLLQDIKANLTRTFPSSIESLANPLTVSGGATPSKTITDISTTDAGIVAIQVDNKGASTNLELTVFSAIGSMGYTTNAVATANFNTTTRNDVIYLDVFFDKVKVVVTNKDASNATTVDVAVKVSAK